MTRSPYLLALLVGLYPITFFMSNNWFMFTAARLALSTVAFVLLIAGLLAGLFTLLSRVLLRRWPQAASQIFVFLSMLLLAHLMRLPLLRLIPSEAVMLLGVTLAAGLARFCWNAAGIHRLNQTLILLSAVSVVQGAVSVARNTAAEPEPTENVAGVLETSATFLRRPHVYYLISDAYPSEEALSRVVNLDSRIYDELESRSFTVYRSAFSNYMSTLSSMLATFSMDHHLYAGRVGNLEILNAREFIVGKGNPVVRIFKNNGYRVVYVQQNGSLLTQGCFVDECMPRLAFTQVMSLLLPDSLKSLRNRLSGQSLEAFERRALRLVKRVSRQEAPQFTYLHMQKPNHSITRQQSATELARFRELFPRRLERANSLILTVVDEILTRDADALIIVSADHGAWTRGSYGWADDDVFEGTEPSLTALDHLGILLAVHWPNGEPASGPELRTSVNLFRHIFAYLTEDDTLLATRAQDHGYLMRGRGIGSTVFRVLEDGHLMTSFVEERNDD